MQSFVFGTPESASTLIWCHGCSSCLYKAIAMEADWASGWPSFVVLSKVTAARWRRRVTDLERAARSPCACRVSRHRPGETSRLRVQHHAQDAVNAEPRVPEAGVGHPPVRSASQSRTPV